jgi:hypothetical protein
LIGPTTDLDSGFLLVDKGGADGTRGDRA